MLKKLKIRFVLINMIIVTAMLLIIFSLIYNFTDNNLKKQSDIALQKLLQAGYQDRSDVPYPYFILRIGSFGDVTATGRTHYNLNSEAFLTEILQEVYDRGEYSGRIQRYNLQYQATVTKDAQYFAFLDVSGHQASLRSMVQASLLIGISSLFVFLGISILLARWSVKPVARAWQQQQQFVSDASHELKTPLTVIMSNAELLQAPDITEESRAQFSENILTMSHQMRHLVEGLLELSRVDNGQVQKVFQPLELSRLIGECILPFEPVLFDKGMTLACDIQPDITVNGNEHYLRQVIEILLDNAGKYGKPGIVNLRLQKDGGHRCLISVANPGTPIPQEESEKIFGRFYRADTARTRDGSFGLGLSIAQSVVGEHGGRIWVESNDTGNCFYISLPAL